MRAKATIAQCHYSVHQNVAADFWGEGAGTVQAKLGGHRLVLTLCVTGLFFFRLISCDIKWPCFISGKKARMHARIVIRALLITLLAGCASAPPLNFSVQNVSPSSHKLDADLRAVSVSYAAPSEQTGEVPSNGETIPELWERAVVEAINKNSMFDDKSTKKVNLFVKIQELDPPTDG